MSHTETKATKDTTADQPQPGDWLAGGCHCGAVRFRARLSKTSAIECNCSICAKKGFINLIVPADDFELLTDDAAMSEYRFNTKAAAHRFCRTCGIHPFSRPRSHPGAFDINARCLDGGWDFLVVEPFDGQNWEASVESIR